MTRVLAKEQAEKLGHQLDPEGWHWVNSGQHEFWPNIRGSIIECFACWRDMVVVQVPRHLITGPMLEEKCDYVGGFLGQSRLEGF